MAIRIIVVFLLFPTLILIACHYYKRSACNLRQRCYATAWTGLAIMIMVGIIYMIYNAERKHHRSTPKVSEESQPSALPLSVTD